MEVESWVIIDEMDWVRMRGSVSSSDDDISNVGAVEGSRSCCAVEQVMKD